jgi:hypothetical protein
MRPVVVLTALLGVATATALAERSAMPVSNPTSSEMTAIFDADQAAREATKIDWPVVREADKRRRENTQRLLAAGQLKSADDFYHAAYVFQHGDLPEHFLKAHALAVVAAARGKSEATWIAAATLDRFLQRIGQPQIYGTQFLRHASSAWTQEPYRRDLLPDALRQATGVPPISEQQGESDEMARETR